MTDKDVCHLLRVVPIEVHLRYARLRVFQNRLKDVHAHELYLSMFLGQMVFESESVPIPWAHQIPEDVMSLDKYDGMVDICDHF
eukprot:10735564-Karenia_brevis.AAC.1